MDRERWNEVDRLLQSALDRPAAERDLFLQGACGGDGQLERELRLLLAAHDDAGNFLGAPAIEMAARDLAERRSRLPSRVICRRREPSPKVSRASSRRTRSCSPCICRRFERCSH
jgi:hypothetical protein